MGGGRSASSADKNQKRIRMEAQTCVGFRVEGCKILVPWRASRHATAHFHAGYFRPLFLNVAVTLFACVNVTVQVPVPVHAPLQPANAARLAGVAAKVTTAPLRTLSLHVVPQSIPAGFEVTWPRSVAVFVTASVTVCTANVAVTFWAWLMFTMQDPAPVQAPLQPAKVDPASGIAISVTGAPLAKLALHGALQLMPPGSE